MVVGAVYSPGTLRAALALGSFPAVPDWIELRVDGFAERPSELDAITGCPPRPLLVTVRDPAEGGLTPGLDATARGRLYSMFLSTAAAVDVEVRSLRALRDTVEAARERGCAVVASYHDFDGAPSLRRLRAAAARAREAGADVFKAAMMVRTPGDLGTLFKLLDDDAGIPMAVMGMGPLGRASRPALAAAGSVLNYGYLGAEPQVAGQWPVAQLRARIDELR